jgi:hypothetical protein
MAKFFKENFDKKESEAAKTFSSSVWLKKNTLKIPVYRYLPVF